MMNKNIFNNYLIEFQKLYVLNLNLKLFYDYPI